MALKFSLIVSMLVKCFLVAGTASIDDPCPNHVYNEIAVATMCTNTTAVENPIDESINVDSAIFRIMEQRSGCIYDVSVKFQVLSPTVFYLRKYNNHFTSTPSTANCGLVIDVENIMNMTETVEQLESIKCLNGYNDRPFTAQDGQIFRLTSQITDDTFTNGYCLQFYRKSNVSKPATLTIECFDHEVIMSTVETTQNQSPTNEQRITESTNTNRFVSEDMQEKTTGDTTTSLKIVPTYVAIQTDLEIQTDSNSDAEEGGLNVYIIAGSSAGGGLIIFLISVFVVCKCLKNSKHDRPLQKQPADKSEDNDSYGLTGNVLYISSDVQENCIGSYNTVALESNQSTANISVSLETTYINSDNEKDEINGVYLETKKNKPALKPKPSNSEATARRAGEANAVEYAVVDKTPKLHDYHVTTEGSNNEYAIVNKTWKT